MTAADQVGAFAVAKSFLGGSGASYYMATGNGWFGSGTGDQATATELATALHGSVQVIK